MSNAICFEPTKFEDLRTGEISYGYRAYDTTESTYCNTWESVPDDDLQFLRLVFQDDNPIVESIVEFMQEERIGCWVGDEYIEWADLEKLLDEEVN